MREEFLQTRQTARPNMPGTDERAN